MNKSKPIKKPDSYYAGLELIWAYTSKQVEGSTKSTGEKYAYQLGLVEGMLSQLLCGSTTIKQILERLNNVNS